MDRTNERVVGVALTWTNSVIPPTDDWQEFCDRVATSSVETWWVEDLHNSTAFTTIGLSGLHQEGEIWAECGEMRCPESSA